MKVRHSVPALLLCTLVCWGAPVRADVVTDWNVFTIQTVGAAGLVARPGPSGILDIAMVHAAMHDAIQAFEKRFEPYSISIANASGSSIAAAATAAHDVLVARFASQQGAIDDFYNAYLQTRSLGGDPGIAVGQQAALAIITQRADDLSFLALPPDAGGTGAGVWRSTPPAFLPFAALGLGNVRPFTLKSSDQFLANEGPPHLTSGAYARAYNEVKALGASLHSARTPEQTELAALYSGNFVALWNPAVLRIAAAQHLSTGDTARLFALMYLAIADAVITAWNTKDHYRFWRPVTAIQEGDNDGNPRTVGDPSWLPLIPTPPYPDYTSGANNFTSALVRTLQQFFRSDTVPFTLGVTDAILFIDNVPVHFSVTRDYTRLSDAAADVVDVRVYLGIHFRFADKVARDQGKHVADWVFSHVLRPVN
jgi:hypothetical protein